MTRRRRRPLGGTFLALYAAFMTVVSLGAASITVPEILEAGLVSHDLALLVLPILWGLIHGFAAVGLWKVRRWAWQLMLLPIVVYLVSGTAQLVLGLALLLLLLLPAVRKPYLQRSGVDG